MITRAKPYYASDGASCLFYDLVAASDPALHGDVDLYADLAGDRSTILELGTGTGRVAIPLAERGFHVTGLDIAPAMLVQADEKKRHLPAEVAARLQFVRGDLLSLALGGRFHAIFATYFTLAHLQPSTSWRRAFAGMARHLAPGGIIAVHLPIAEAMAAPPPPSDTPVFQHAIDDCRLLTLFVAGKQSNSDAGRMDLDLDYVVTDRSSGKISRSRERLTYFAADPDLHAERAGLRRAREPIPVGKSGFLHLFEWK